MTPKTPFYRILLSATGVTVAVQLLGLFRQTLVVKYFGLTRELDLFWTVYAMATVTVFGLNVIVESTFTALATKIREAEGEVAFRQALRPFALVSMVIGVVAALLFMALVPLLAPLFGAGFSADERERLVALAAWYMPWIVLVIVYYAAMALLRAAWAYSAVFIGEAIVVVASIGALMAWHGSLNELPLAFAIGYGTAVAWLAFRMIGVSESGAAKGRFPMREFLRRATTHYSALQLTTLSALAERLWMSFIPAGGIATLGVAQQLSMGLGGLLSFRDAYLAPLAIEQGRGERLRRLIVGTYLASLAVTALAAMTAPEIAEVLFVSDKVTSADVALLAVVLSIVFVGLVPASVGAQIWRALQMTGRHRMFVIAFALNGLGTLAFGWLLIAKLDLGAPGIAMVPLINATYGIPLALYGARELGCRLSRQDWKLVLVATIALPSLAAASVHVGRSLAGTGSFPTLVLAGVFYVAALALVALPFRGQLSGIVRGDAQHARK